MPEREQFIIRVGALCEKDLFLDSPWDDLRQPLAALHQQCWKRIWAYAKTVCVTKKHEVVRNPTILSGQSGEHHR